MTTASASQPSHEQGQAWYERVSTVISWMLLLLAVYTAGAMIHTVIRAYTPLPWWDQWAYLERVHNIHDVSTFFKELIRQHNEHRILFPGLLNFADLWLFQGRNTFLLASILLIQSIHLLFVTFMFRRMGGLRGTQLRTAFSLTAFCMFYLMQWENFIWGFQTAFVLLALSASVAFFSFAASVDVALADENRAARYFGLGIAAALVGNYSLANGIILWPMLVLFAFVLGCGLRRILVTAIVGAAATLFYLQNYIPPEHHSSPLESLRHPQGLITYVLTYLLSLWRFIDIRIGYVVVSVSVLVVIGFLLLMLRRSKSVSSFESALGFLCLFYIGTAILTGSGRLRFGIIQAYSSRYQTFSLIYWAFFAVLLLYRYARSPRALLLLQLAIVVALVPSATRLSRLEKEAAWNGHYRNGAIGAVALGIRDDELLDRIYVRRDEVLQRAQWLKQKQLSIFADPLYQSIGWRIEERYHILPSGRCQGAFERAYPVGSAPNAGYRAEGYIWDAIKKHSLERLVITDQEGAVIGYANGNQALPVGQAVSTPKNSAWIGDFIPSPGIRSARAYGLISNDEACRIQGEFALLTRTATPMENRNPR